MTGNGTLFVGLGTSHGDDSIGLFVAEQVEAYNLHGVQVHRTRTPAEILDWLTDVERLVVCDACQSDSRSIGKLHRWEWPAEEIDNVRFAGSHDLSLAAVLTLAERLGRRPQEVIILGVEVGRIAPGEIISPELKAAIPDLVQRIRGVLESA